MWAAWPPRFRRFAVGIRAGTPCSLRSAVRHRKAWPRSCNAPRRGRAGGGRRWPCCRLNRSSLSSCTGPFGVGSRCRNTTSRDLCLCSGYCADCRRGGFNEMANAALLVTGVASTSGIAPRHVARCDMNWLAVLVSTSYQAQLTCLARPCATRNLGISPSFSAWIRVVVPASKDSTRRCRSRLSRLSISSMKESSNRSIR